MTHDGLIALADFEVAARRIAGRVRRTPMIAAAPLRRSPGPWDLRLKLECLQITGSFKPRGATNKLLSLSDAEVRRGIITASGGNHGLAVAYAGWQAKTPAVIYLPRNTPADKIGKIKSWGAEAVLEGAVWDDANEVAMRRAERDGLTYLHPFADPAVIAGQGTLGLEILADVPDCDVLVIAIGGGGLISGIAGAVKAIKPAITVIGVEPVGAPTLKESVAAGRLVTLPGIETAAGTLAPRCSAEINLEIIRRHVDQIVLVSDQDMTTAAGWLWAGLGIAAELSGAAAMAALLTGKVAPPAGSVVGVLVCGAGRDGMTPKD